LGVFVEALPDFAFVAAADVPDPELSACFHVLQLLSADIFLVDFIGVVFADLCHFDVALFPHVGQSVVQLFRLLFEVVVHEYQGLFLCLALGVLLFLVPQLLFLGLFGLGQRVLGFGLLLGVECDLFVECFAAATGVEGEGVFANL
jgi:hypothetical protein